jgi:hypothetical protein
MRWYYLTISFAALSILGAFYGFEIWKWIFYLCSILCGGILLHKIIVRAYKEMNDILKK